MITLQIRSSDAALLWTLLGAMAEVEDIQKGEIGYRLGEVEGNLGDLIADDDGIMPSCEGSAYHRNCNLLWAKLAKVLWPEGQPKL